MTKVTESLKGMFTGSFAMVMATGIVSIASERLGHHVLGLALLRVNVVLLCLLTAFLLLRALTQWPMIMRDMVSPVAGPGFFTVPTGYAVFGSQCLEFGGSSAVVFGLGLVALILWLAITVTFFFCMIAGENKPDAHLGINGAWLIAVVATQSLSTLASTLALHEHIEPKLGFYVSACFACAGALLYMMLISIIAYRLVVHPVRPQDLSAPYWVNMGAAMITSMAFSRASLIADGEAHAPVRLMGMLFWSFGVWWIPILLCLGIWKHVVRHVPLNYDPRLWSVVFPLGMFAASSNALSHAWDWHGFREIASVAIHVAIGAWAILFLGLAKTTFRWLIARPQAI